MGEQVLLIKRDELSQLIGEAVKDALKSFGETLSGPKKEDPKFVKGNQALADYLDCSVGSVIKWKNLGIIPYTKRGRIILYDIEKVRSALNNNKLLKRKG